MSLSDRARREFLRLPPGLRGHVLHGLGRYAPWEEGFDFTPPPVPPGQVTGPPDFVGVGVQKAGTTWWYRLILLHPDVSGPADIHKERHFFDRFGSTPFTPEDITRYHGWFPRPEGSRAGEWTPDYVTFAWAPELLKRAAPRAKVLVLLRDPVERLRSGLDHQRRMGVAPTGATTAGAIERGFYRRSLDRWFDHFDPEQVLVLQYERCTADPLGQLQDTFRFLDLPDFTPQDLGLPRPHPQPDDHRLDPDVRERLVAVYQSDVIALVERFPQIDPALWPNFAYLAGSGTSGTSGASGTSNSPT